MRHVFWIAAFAFVSACSSGEGTLEVSLTTDVAPAPEVAIVDGIAVTVTSVDVAVAEPEGWLTVFDGAQALNLLATDETKAFLGSVVVPAGPITQVRLVLAPDPTITIGTTVSPLRCPSCTQTGIKIVPHGALTVPEGGALDLALTFDVRASLHRDPIGYWLQPVVRL